MAASIIKPSNDPRTLADLESIGLDNEQSGLSFEASDAPLFKAGCEVLSAGDLEALISDLLDAEFNV
jgi:hypothetical protein